MFFQRIDDRQLAQASYLIGCQATGEALVIDPNRDVDQYVAAATAERLRITHVTETHIHADFVSGARELAKRTGAKLLLSGEGGRDWQYAFAAEAGATILKDADSWMVGRLRIDVVHTPGHTPEHLMLILTDLPASNHPVMAFTGDFVFVGDVGRPDLLEKAAGQANTMAAGARELWRSIARFRALPDYVQVWPGHGAGSACGKALGAVPATTVGYEKLVNWGVAAPDEDTFVKMVLDGQPDPPAYFARMKRVNRDGPPPLREATALSRLTSDELSALQRQSATLIDIRPARAFAAGHVRGAISVPFNRSFTKYAGSVVSPDAPVVFITDDRGTVAADAARALLLIGVESATGFIPHSAADAGALEPLERVETGEAIRRHAAGAALVDVRDRFEWESGHVPAARHVPLAELVARADELPRDTPVLVYCQTGSRSAIAASVLRTLGVDAHDAGGMVAWRRSGGPIETAAPAAV